MNIFYSLFLTLGFLLSVSYCSNMNQNEFLAAVKGTYKLVSNNQTIIATPDGQIIYSDFQPFLNIYVVKNSQCAIYYKSSDSGNLYLPIAIKNNNLYSHKCVNTMQKVNFDNVTLFATFQNR